MTLPAWPLLSAFLLASLLLAVTPGPAVTYIVTRTLASGLRAGRLSVLGAALGNLANAVAAVAGLAALFLAFPESRLLVQLAGGGYLAWLGIRNLWRSTTPAAGDAAPLAADSALRDAFWVALLNPKTALFFAAFLPQFYAEGGSPLLQGLALGTAFVLIAAVTDLAHAQAAATIGAQLQPGSPLRRAGRWISAATYLGLAAWVIFDPVAPA